MAEDSAPKAGSIRARAVSGVGWVGFSQIAVQLTRMFVAIGVARMLTPSEYGLAALTLVFASLVLIFSDLALGAALVQRKTVTDDDKNTAFWTTVASGVIFLVLGVALSGPMAGLYGEPDTQPLFAALSVTFVVASLGATQQALLLRDMAFRRLELLSVAGAMAGAPIALALAAAGAGPWAIIGQHIAVATATSALMWRASDWRPQLRFSKASLKDLWSFSGFLVGHRLLYYTQQNADNFIIGRWVGSAAVGAYAIAYQVMLAPASRIGGPIQRVLAPAFSRMQDEPKRIAEAWAKVVRMIAAISVPALAGVIVVADDFVAVALGSSWAAAAPIIQILAWVGILQALQSTNVDILMARDRTALMFRFTCLFVVAHVTAFAVGVQWGVTGVAAAYAISSTIVDPILTIITARVLGVSPMIFVRAVSGVFQAAIGMMIAVAAARMALVDADVPALARLVLCVAVGAVVYVPLLAWRAPEVVRDTRALLPARFRRGRAPVPATAES
ncbi:MOP flippase family protein [Solirubrobacter phytolaccae]|uniref:MOP flippase family protein n=1 Tax=Solirubrobacter phytolaccae TaxID=1404360 RepID=A0A9X3N606_9ACTN|nr:MOP flippase family protein [Solirubrobacter phytolaccae]MDA0180323.1 MOP flippase family protein [Solirubrobacter phytolaccae]